jgi:hypothetical protein
MLMKVITGVFRKYVVFLNKKAHFSISHEECKVANPSRNGESLYGKKIAGGQTHLVIAELY